MPIQSRVKEGTPAFRPLSIGKARIEGTLSKVAYCRFKEKPVCLVVIDLDFEYHKGCVLKDAQIRLTIESESQGDGIEKAEDGILSVSSPKSALRFGPRDHFGIVKNITSHNEYEFAGGHVGNQIVTGPEVKICRRTTEVQESRWQVQGRADREPRGQTYTWSAFGNRTACKDVASDKAFPRKLSIWMVVEHENKRFHADIEVTGKCRSNWFPQSWGRHNDQREADRKVFEPAPSTNILDIDKLSQLIDTRNRDLKAYTSELDLESCFVTKAVPSNKMSEERAQAWSRRRKLSPSRLGLMPMDQKDDGGQARQDENSRRENENDQ